MNYKQFLALVNEELDYLQAFDLAFDVELLKAAGALVTLKEYLERQIQGKRNDR